MSAPDPALLARLERNAADIAWVAGLLAPYGDEEPAGGWSPRQQLFHLLDTERNAHAARIEATLREDRPVFEEWDEEAAMAAAWPVEEDIVSLAGAMSVQREQTVAQLRAASPADWSRTATWPDGSIVSLAWIARRTLYHSLEHYTSMLDAYTRLEAARGEVS